MLLLGGCARRPSFDPDTVFSQATLLHQRGDLQQALKLADRGLAQFSSRTDSNWYWKFRLLRAEVLMSSSRTPEASSLLQASAPALPRDPELQARLLLDQGWAESNLSHFREAKQLFDQSLQLAESHRLPSLETGIRLRRGAASVRLGDMSAAEADFRSALARSEQLKDDYLRAQALGNLGFLRMNTARYDEAVFWFDRALVLFHQLQLKSSIARALNNIGYCYTQLGQSDKATPLFEQAARMAADTGDLADRYVSLGRLADSYQDNGNYKEALSYYQQAIAVARQADSPYWAAKWLGTIAATSAETGDLVRAEDYNRQAIAARSAGRQSRGEPSAANQRGPDRRSPAAAEPGRANLPLRDSSGGEASGNGSARASCSRRGAGWRISWCARTASARRERISTCSRLSSMRRRSELIHYEYRISYLSSLVQFYQDYVDFLVAQNRSVEALTVAESSRARVLTEMLGGSGASGTAAQPADYRKLARASKNILLSYWLAPARSFLWVITPSQISLSSFPPRQRFSLLVNSIAATIEGLHDPLREGGDAGRRLYQAVVAPALSLVPAGSNVAIVADGALHNLDFGTLPAAGPQSHYWIEDVTLSVVPSLDLLYRNLGRQREPDGFASAHRRPAAAGSEEISQAAERGAGSRWYQAPVQPGRRADGRRSRSARLCGIKARTVFRHPLRRPR